MADIQISPPERFNFTQPEGWLKWSRRFERFRHASGLSEKDEVSQVHTLIYSMGDEAEDILSSFCLTEEQRKSYRTVMDRFETHFVKRKNIIFERAKFNRRKQGENEPVDEFIMDLYRLAEHCQYEALHDELIRDRIVVGLHDSALSEKLQMDAKLTLDKAVTAARQAESIKREQTLMRNDFQESKPQRTPELLDYVERKQSRPGGKPYRVQGGPQKPKTCSRCGRSPIHSRQQCPAKDELCHKCGRKGHFQSMCRTRGAVRSVTSASEKEAFMGAVQDSEHTDPWMITLSVNGKPVEFKIDTGADVSVIPHSVFKNLPTTNLKPAQKVLSGPSHKLLPVKGQFVATLKNHDKEVEEEVFVVRRLRRALLGRPAIESLGLIRRLNAVQTKTDLVRDFPKLFQGLGKLEEDYKIQLKEDAKPHALTTPWRVAIPMLPKVKAELERMERMGVVSRVQEPTEWCAGMVVVPKPGDKVRICVDLTHLNKSVRRENHPLPAVEQTLAQLAGARVFTKLDANSGFWQIPLAKESSLLTTFITPYGRFRFNRLPFGITSAPEHFQRRMSGLLQDMEGTVCLMDDILVHGRSQEEHDQRLIAVLCRLQEAGITLNEKKCEFSQNRVKFLGQIVDSIGVRPDPEKITAIQNLPTPMSVGDIRRFLGMANQLSKFSPNMANKTKPLRDLLSNKNQWCWDRPQQEAFEDIKNEISKSPVLSLFDPNRETTVSADASSYGVGAVLMQKQVNGEKRPVAFASRAMTPTEQRYAQIEKEALAITWACDRFADYLMGLQFHIETDHKPLVPLLGTKRLDELPLRVQRFRMRLLRYNFSISHVPGKNLVTPDTLSRAPVSGVTELESMQNEVQAYVDGVFESIPATEKRLEEIRQHQDEDESFRLIKTYCQTEWPTKGDTPGVIQPYYSVAAELTVEKGILMRGSRVVIPASLRVSMLDKIHSGHQGIHKCRERARHSVWWPGISRQVEEMVKSCPECIKHNPQRPQPLLPSHLPDLPWQKVGTDLFELNKNTYLLIVDYFSRWIEVAKLNKLTSEEVINCTRSIFARHGIPEVVVSDNGPQYSAELYAKFARDYGFQHVKSSPHYPQGNGEAERAVKTIKGLLKKSDDPYLAILAYRSTPLECGFSPAQLLMSRSLRTTLPVIREQRMPRVVDLTRLQEKDNHIKKRQKYNYDQSHRTKELPMLEPGDTVWIPDRESPGTVVEKTSLRSHIVETQDGSYRRNRQHLRKMLSPDPVQTSESSEPLVERSTRSRDGRLPRPPDRYDPSWN